MWLSNTATTGDSIEDNDVNTQEGLGTAPHQINAFSPEIINKWEKIEERYYELMASEKVLKKIVEKIILKMLRKKKLNGAIQAIMDGKDPVSCDMVSEKVRQLATKQIEREHEESVVWAKALNR